MSEKASRVLFGLGSLGAAIVVVALMVFYIYLNGPLSVPLYSVMGGCFCFGPCGKLVEAPLDHENCGH